MQNISDKPMAKYWKAIVCAEREPLSPKKYIGVVAVSERLAYELILEKMPGTIIVDMYSEGAINLIEETL